MSTGEIIASVLGEFEDFLRKVGKMEIFDTLVYNYRLKPSISNLTPELFTDLFAQLLDKLLDLKNNLLHWNSIQEFTLSSFQASLPISVTSHTAVCTQIQPQSDIDAHLNPENAIISSVVSGISSNNPYEVEYDLSSHNDGCPSNLDVGECSFPVVLPLLKSNSTIVSALITNRDNRSLNTNRGDSSSSEGTQMQEINRNDNTRKSFQCQVCGKMYSTVQSLRSHFNVHTKLKTFKCSFCEKVFMRKDKLTFHEAVHTGEKSFTCEICGKSFTRKTKLDDHLRRHTGLKKYKCLKCNKAYFSSRDLKRHLLKQDCTTSAQFDFHDSGSNCVKLQEDGSSRTIQLEEDDDVTITQEVSEIFKLNWQELQFPLGVESDTFNLDSAFVLQ